VAFDPPSAALTLDGTTSKDASFTLKATVNGTTVSVIPDSIEFDRPDLAKSQIGKPVVLTADGKYSGQGTLHGVYGGKEATATLSVTVTAQEIGSGVDPAAVAALQASNPPPDGAVTQLLYPYDQTVFPLGLASPLLMWDAPNANDVYRVHLEEKGYSYDGFFTVAQPAQLRVSQDTWDRITASNGGDALKLTLYRWDAATKTAFTSATESFSIVGASLRGAIYYWTTSSGGHMSRIRPGTGATPEILNGGKCMGCHAVSADGTTLAASVDDSPSTDDAPMSAKRAWVSFDLPAASTRATSTNFAGNVAVNPDGKYVVFGDRTLKLGNTQTGQPITGSGIDTVALDTGMNGLMTPAFSPDGTKLAAVEGKGSWFHDLVGGKLVVLDFSESTQKFSNLSSLAPASSFPAAEQAIAYPSFTPDSKQLAFHVGNFTTGCNATGCDDKATQTGSIWLQNLSGASPVRLVRLADSSAKVADHDLSFEPTFNPVERGGTFWVVFTSSRDWGNRISGTPNNGKKRLWVAAIDKTGGTDPSHPAFFLEGQEEATTNMRGFWALAACTPTAGNGGGGGTCAAGFECCSGFCDSGKCVDKGSQTCKGVGVSCTTDSECCNDGAVRCLSGTCTTYTPH
jgi:hypothetical protein